MSVLNQKRRPNVPHEEEFLRSVEAGDYPTVRRMLRNNPNLDVNCTDLLGRTPLRIAVQNENEEIVEILLDRAGTRNMYESLLLAISLDHEHIALSILRHPMYAKLEQQTRLYSNDSIFLSSNNEDSLFASETTPLILAAQKNRYEVLSHLLKRGAKIEEPHEMSCDCARCETYSQHDELRYAKSRLNAYKGLASEAYICLASPDPILTAFNLRKKLNRVATNEKHYRDEYQELRDRLGQYVVKLLDCVRGNEELDVLLSTENGDEGEQLGRLHLALRYNEKKFVAHSSCQKKLTTIWYGQAQRHFHRWPSWAYPIFVTAMGFCFPFLSLIYLCAPSSKVGKVLKTPFIKFIGQSMSFFFFLFLICIFSLTEKPSTNISNSPFLPGRSEAYKAALQKYSEVIAQNLTEAGYGLSIHHREYMPPGIQMVLNVFVIGMLWQECKQLYGSSLREYLSSLFNIMDSFSLVLYLASFALRYVSSYKTVMSRNFFDHESNILALVRGEAEALEHLYWIYADRFYWSTMDPIVVAEGLFAIANVVSFTRLFYLLAANEQLGPLQISLRRMIGDISRFMAILIIIFTAFMVGLNNLYWYYEPDVRSIVELNTHPEIQTEAENAFGTIEKTFTTMFWAMFGMGESSVVKLGDSYNGGFTERIGYIVFGAYNIAIVVILLNMLIAMMSRSFEAIADEEDVEWKFARAQLYMDYIQEGSTLPVPFNIIPSPKTIVQICTSLYRRFSKARNSPDDKGSPDDRDSPDNKDSPGEMNNMRHLQDKPDTKGIKTPIVTSRKDSKTGSVSSRSSAGHTKVKKDDSVGGAAVKKIQKLFNSKEQKPQITKPSFETVMKRLIKRYIFESQQVETSPLEGDIDELKQDLSGVRYEINNMLTINQKKVVASVNMLNTKLDILTAKINSPYAPCMHAVTAPVNQSKPSSVFTRLHNQLQDRQRIGKYAKGFRGPRQGQNQGQSQGQGQGHSKGHSQIQGQSNSRGQSQTQRHADNPMVPGEWKHRVFCNTQGQDPQANEGQGHQKFRSPFNRGGHMARKQNKDSPSTSSNKSATPPPVSDIPGDNQVKVKNNNSSRSLSSGFQGSEDSLRDANYQLQHSDLQQQGRSPQGHGIPTGQQNDLQKQGHKDNIHSKDQHNQMNQMSYQNVHPSRVHHGLHPHSGYKNHLLSQERPAETGSRGQHAHSEGTEGASSSQLVERRNLAPSDGDNGDPSDSDTDNQESQYDDYDSSATEDGCSNIVEEDDAEEEESEMEENELEEEREGDSDYGGREELWLQQSSGGEMENYRYRSHPPGGHQGGEGRELDEEGDWEEEGEEEREGEELTEPSCEEDSSSTAVTNDDGVLEEHSGVGRLRHNYHDNGAFSAEEDICIDQSDGNKTYPSVSFGSPSRTKKRRPHRHGRQQGQDPRQTSLHLNIESDQEIDC